MALSAEYLAYLEDLFSIVADTTIRRMFGGVGIFRDGLMFALATGEGRLAFKADEQTVSAFSEAGAEEWVYENRSRGRKNMGYWYVPDFVLEDQDEFHSWALAAFEVARRADAKKPPGKRKLHT